LLLAIAVAYALLTPAGEAVLALVIIVALLALGAAVRRRCVGHTGPAS
jgi:hypothetical protein